MILPFQHQLHPHASLRATVPLSALVSPPLEFPSLLPISIPRAASPSHLAPPASTTTAPAPAKWPLSVEMWLRPRGFRADFGVQGWSPGSTVSRSSRSTTLYARATSTTSEVIFARVYPNNRSPYSDTLVAWRFRSPVWWRQ